MAEEQCLHHSCHWLRPQLQLKHTSGFRLEAVVGKGAGFMLVSFGIDGGGPIGVSDARFGRGDLSCVDGLLGSNWI